MFTGRREDFAGFDIEAAEVVRERAFGRAGDGDADCRRNEAEQKEEALFGASEAGFEIHI